MFRFTYTDIEGHDNRGENSVQPEVKKLELLVPHSDSGYPDPVKPPPAGENPDYCQEAFAYREKIDFGENRC